jgi:hypothetical protein
MKKNISTMDTLNPSVAEAIVRQASDSKLAYEKAKQNFCAKKTLEFSNVLESAYTVRNGNVYSFVITANELKEQEFYHPSEIAQSILTVKVTNKKGNPVNGLYVTGARYHGSSAEKKGQHQVNHEYNFYNFIPLPFTIKPSFSEKLTEQFSRQINLLPHELWHVSSSSMIADVPAVLVGVAKNGDGHTIISPVTTQAAAGEKKFENLAVSIRQHKSNGPETLAIPIAPEAATNLMTTLMQSYCWDRSADGGLCIQFLCTKSVTPNVTLELCFDYSGKMQQRAVHRLKHLAEVAEEPLVAKSDYKGNYLPSKKKADSASYVLSKGGSIPRTTKDWELLLNAQGLFASLAANITHEAFCALIAKHAECEFFKNILAFFGLALVFIEGKRVAGNDEGKVECNIIYESLSKANHEMTEVERLTHIIDVRLRCIVEAIANKKMEPEAIEQLSEVLKAYVTANPFIKLMKDPTFVPESATEKINFLTSFLDKSCLKPPSGTMDPLLLDLLPTAATPALKL